MITILHGDNVYASRKELDKIKETFDGEIIRLDGKNLSETDLVQATKSKSLLASQKLVIVENFLSDKKRKEFDFSDIEGDLVFWDDQELGKTVLNELKDLKYRIFLFKTPITIFKFCDQIAPQNSKNLLSLFKECLQSGEPEYIFIMIVRQFRLMLNPTGAAPWQQAKLVSQAKSFGEKRLGEIYKNLLEIDYQTKSGLSVGGLAFNLELFLLNL